MILLMAEDLHYFIYLVGVNRRSDRLEVLLGVLWEVSTPGDNFSWIDVPKVVKVGILTLRLVSDIGILLGLLA